eukprot:jgi/Ulvmu1/3954/UM018_0177.1
MNRDLLQEGLEGGEEEAFDKKYIGAFEGKIVGVNHYRGHVNNREMVMLRREPDNPYDMHAVQVLNIQDEQVGHLPRVIVSVIAPLMDDGLLFVEGVIPRGSKNVYKIPLKLLCFAKEGQEDVVMGRLRAGRLYVSGDYAAESLFERSSQVSLGLGLGIGVGSQGSQDTTQGAPQATMQVHQVEDSLSRLFDDLLAESDTVQRMQPHTKHIVTPLLRHQQEALAWMVQQENSNELPPFWDVHKPVTASASVAYTNTLSNFVTEKRPEPFRGGILADDMGLGKTLTILALIATNAAGAQLPDVNTEPRLPAADARDADWTPEKPAAKSRRRSASKRSASQGSPAARAAATPSPAKKRKPTAAQQRLLDAAAAAAEPNAAPAAGGARPTLVVCPVSVLSNWEVQIAEHTAGLASCVFHGPRRSGLSAADLAKQDVVITTYGIVVSDARKLKRVQWQRIVLDEGHFVKNAATKQSQCCAELPARSRWLVTGTPIQNSMKDLYGLLAFLRLAPLTERSVFRAAFERPMAAGNPTGLLRLKVLMAAVAMRRTKTMKVGGRSIVELPEKRIHVVKVNMLREQRSKYEQWAAAARTFVAAHLEADTLLRHYSSVLEALLRLRQICDSAALVTVEPPKPPEADAHTAPGSALPAAQQQELVMKLTELVAAGALDECPICMDDVTAPVITPCAHVFCGACLESWLLNEHKACPLCRGSISKATIAAVPPESAPEAAALTGQPAAEAHSAKLAALLERLREAATESADLPRPIKSVVFSQFTGMLDAVGAALDAEGFPHVRVDGAMSQPKRAKAIAAFSDTGADTPLVALVSLKAGGVGLNLTAASQIHLLDPWWNPATEDQAMDRVHRIGQQRPVAVWRYVSSDSIEERMLVLQDRKRELAQASFERRRPEEQQAARIADVRLLMDL